MWARMTQLFKSKWVYQEGEIKQRSGEYEKNFLFWCEKLAGMTDEQWRRGFAQLEFMVRDAARQGEDMWPPSYAAFLGMCDGPKEQEDPRKKALHKFVTPYFKVEALEDKTAIERSQAIGSSTLESLKSMFDEG